MITDAHVYCLPEKMLIPGKIFLKKEAAIRKAIFNHPEGEYALSLSKIDNIKKSMSESSVDKAVLLAFPWNYQENCNQNNEHLLNIFKKEKNFYIVCSVQPNSKDCLKQVERLLKEGAIGIKINPDWQEISFDPAKLRELGKTITENKGFVFLHTDHPFRNTRANPSFLLELAALCPELKILAAHMGGMIGLYRLHKSVEKLFSNIWFDTAVSSTMQFIKFYLEAGLSDKIIFGTDFPFNHCHSQKEVLSGLTELRLGVENEKAILNGNFSSFLKKVRG